MLLTIFGASGLVNNSKPKSTAGLPPRRSEALAEERAGAFKTWILHEPGSNLLTRGL